MMFDLKMLIIAVGAALVSGAAVGGWLAWDIRDTKANLQLLDLRTTYDTATAKAKDAAHQVERDLQDKIDELGKKGSDENRQITANVAAAADSTGGLLQAAATRFSAAACDPGVARRGQAATDTAFLYSQLLGESQLLAKGLAEEADRARSAGASCEIAYDLVRRGLKSIAKGPALTGG